jgi:hypothetical protein
MVQEATNMSTRTVSRPPLVPNPVTPLWRDLLARRGLSEGTIAHFNITPRGEGWQYPVHPAVSALRWKAFDSASTPKYLWLPGKPDGVRFYDCDATLRDEVTISGGVLWLASGESDVWALWEGGIRNATCLFDGEARRMPPWLGPDLEQLGVRELHLAPDRDPAGMRFVIHISRAVSATAIRIIMHKLPFPPRSKGDVGRLLVEVGASHLKATLRTLPAFEAAFEPSDTSTQPTFTQLPLPDPSADQHDLYGRWSVDVVEACALRVWAISPPDKRGFSKNFLCPFHPDRHPSAGWNYHTHGIYCFACGPHSTQEIADWLGVQSWESFRADHLAR